MHGLRSLLDSAGDAFALARDGNVYRIGLWLLAGVFAWSGLAKIRSPAVAALALVDFRLASSARRRWGRGLGGAELVLAAILAIGAVVGYPLAVFPLAATVILLAFFCALITRSLLAGEEFPCACFGNADSTLSPLSLVRTGCLALLALCLVLATPDGGATVGEQQIVLQLLTAAATMAIVVQTAQAARLVRMTRSILRPEVPEK